MDPVGEPDFLANLLSCPEILSMVLKNFSNDELLELSRVNQLANYEARKILKARGDVIATTQESNTCKDLEDFAIGLQLMRIMPFAGMKIKLGGQHECSREALPGHELNVVCKIVLDRINWRILAVQFLSDWNEHENCPGFVLLKKILLKNNSILQEFSLLGVQNPTPFLQNVLQGYEFTNLSTLKLRDVGDYTSSEDYTNFIKGLVSRAPNLQTLHTEGRVDLRGNLLEGSRAVHVTGYPYSPSLGEIPENVVSSIRLKRINLIDTNERITQRQNRRNRIIFNLLEASRTTLVEMHTDLPSLSPLMTHGISLDSVKKIKINLANTHDSEVVRLLAWYFTGNFDFNSLFPSLDTVHVHAERHAVSRRFVTLVSSVVNRTFKLAAQKERAPRTQRAAHIKNLKVNLHSELDWCIARGLANMFPNVQTLSIRSKASVPFEVIWRSWRHVEELDVAIEDPSTSWKLDEVFCGIHPQKVAQLREKDDDYLRNVDIVPVKASIANLKNLRTLTISLESTRSDLEINPSIWFSRVTPLIAFKKFPNLHFTVNTNNQNIDKALSHLKPYVRVVLGNPN